MRIETRRDRQPNELANHYPELRHQIYKVRFHKFFFFNVLVLQRAGDDSPLIPFFYLFQVSE